MQEKPNTNNRKTGRTNQRNYNRSKNSVTKKTINRNNYYATTSYFFIVCKYTSKIIAFPFSFTV